MISGYYLSVLDRSVYIMGFKIEKEEYVNKTFRMNKKLVDQLEKICDEKNISLNKLVVKCIEYALNDMEEDED